MHLLGGWGLGTSPRCPAPALQDKCSPSLLEEKKKKKKPGLLAALALNKKVLIHIHVGESCYYHTYILGSG